MRVLRSTAAISANSSWLARVARTPSTTSFSLVAAISRICTAAFSTAISSGTAISARPSSIRPESDFGRAQRIGAF